jgi:hypothetical protein
MLGEANEWIRRKESGITTGNCEKVMCHVFSRFRCIGIRSCSSSVMALMADSNAALIAVAKSGKPLIGTFKLKLWMILIGEL